LIITNTFVRLSVFIILLFASISQAFGYDSLRLALNLHQSSQYQKALPVFIKLSKKFSRENDISNHALCQLKIADIIRAYGGPHISLLILDKSESLLKLKIERPSEVLSETLLMKAECLYDIGHYEEYKRIINESIRNRKLLTSPDNNPAKEFMHRARYYQNVPNSRDSVEYWGKESLRLAKSNTTKFIYVLPKIYLLLGFHVHLLNNRYYNSPKEFYEVINTSRAYYDSALRLVMKAPMIDSITLGRIYHNLGNSYNNETGVNQQRKTFNKSLDYYNKSIMIAEKFGSPSELATKDWVIAVAYERLKIRDSTLLFFQKGMEKLMPGFDPKSLRDLPPITKTLNDKLFFTFSPQMFNQFHLKYKEQGNIDDLISAYYYGIYCIKFYRHLLAQTYSDQETMYGFYLFIEGYHQRLAEITNKLFTLTHDNNYLKEAYPYLVSSKYAFLNNQDIYSKTIMKNGMGDLGDELVLIKKNILENSPNFKIEEFLKEYLRTTADVEKNIKSQKEQQNIILDLVSIEQIQNRIKNQNTAVIDYYWSGGLHVICITENDVFINSLQPAKDLGTTTWLLRKNMVGMKSKEYARQSFNIYMQVLDSILLQLPESIDRLIICPDSQLQLIPWDALVQDTTTDIQNFKTLKYLVNRYQVDVVFTLNHLFNKPQSYDQNFIGVASDFKDSQRFSSLPFSSALVKRAASDNQGKVNTDFPASPISTKLFHLATHIRADSARPFQSAIFFNDQDSIVLGRLAPSSAKIGLAILNGCETSGVTSYSGEGTIGFARAFYRMGVSSIIMTLWSVDDKATADILSEFYSQMEDGNHLDASLRNAKLDFLENVASDELANPYYWAGLQLTGNTDALFKSIHYRKTLVVVIGTAIILLALYFLRSRLRLLKSL